MFEISLVFRSLVLVIHSKCLKTKYNLNHICCPARNLRPRLTINYITSAQQFWDNRKEICLFPDVNIIYFVSNITLYKTLRRKILYDTSENEETMSLVHKIMSYISSLRDG